METSNTDLLDRKDAPSYLTESEPFILTSYRKRSNFLQCLSSIFKLHNETLNIWSHLLGAAYMAILTKRRWQSNASSHTGLRRVPPMLVGTAGTILFLASANAHTFACHSKKTCKCCFAVDKSMISYFLLGCAISSSIVFFRRPTQRLTRNVFITAATASSTFAALQISGVLKKTSKIMNVLILASQAVTGLVPPVLEYITSQRSDVKKLIFEKASLASILAVIGASFYASYFPEKKFPKTFDVYGNSHTIMHIFVVGSAHVAFHGFSAAVDLVLR
jgi:adiponectin receptor